MFHFGSCNSHNMIIVDLFYLSSIRETLIYYIILKISLRESFGRPEGTLILHIFPDDFTTVSFKVLSFVNFNVRMPPPKKPSFFIVYSHLIYFYFYFITE